MSKTRFVYFSKPPSTIRAVENQIKTVSQFRLEGISPRQPATAAEPCHRIRADNIRLPAGGVQPAAHQIVDVIINLIVFCNKRCKVKMKMRNWLTLFVALFTERSSHSMLAQYTRKHSGQVHLMNNNQPVNERHESDNQHRERNIPSQNTRTANNVIGFICSLLEGVSLLLGSTHLPSR